MTCSKPTTLWFGKYKGVQIEKMPISYLAWVWGSFTRERRTVEPDLRRRGCNDADFVRIASRFPCLGAHPRKMVAPEPPPKRRSTKRRRRAERRRQRHIAVVAKVKEGFRITGESFDPSACDGSCPF